MEEDDSAHRRKIVDVIDHTLGMRQMDREKLVSSLEEHSQVKALLADLPSRLKHPAMIPMGPFAFRRGHIVRGNEVVTFLGDAYFAEQTASDASKFVSRRISNIESGIREIDKSIDQLKERRAFFLQNQDVDGNLNEGLEIREDFDENVHLQPATSTSQKPSDDHEDEDLNFEDLMREIDRLEALEKEHESRLDVVDSNEGKPLPQTPMDSNSIKQPSGDDAKTTHDQPSEQPSGHVDSQLNTGKNRQVVNDFQISERPVAGVGLGENAPAPDEQDQQPEQKKVSKFMKSRISNA